MKTKVLLTSGVSLFLFCTAISTSFAQAGDYVTKSQINAANGVAGLNANQQVTANIKTEEILIRNNPVIAGYDIDESQLYSSPVQGGYELVSPYNNNEKASLIFLSKKSFDNKNTRPNTLMLGGNSRNAIVGIKATCQNTSSSDAGGACYQFIDMAGPFFNNRSGAGWTDGVNMEFDTQDNSPLDVIGGNILITTTNAPYEVKGTILKPIGNVKAGDTRFIASGIFGCGNGGGLSHCQMKIINGKDNQGNDNIIFTGRVIPGQYDAEKGTIEIQLANGAKLPSALTPSSQLEIKYYSADGVAYGVKFQKTSVIIYPALSQAEANLIHDRMALWTNFANGMRSTEPENVDKPNYYYGYNQGFSNKIINKEKFDSETNNINNDTSKTDAEKKELIKKLNQDYTYTIINIETQAAIQDGYIGDNWTNLNKAGWVTLNQRESSIPVVEAPGNNAENKGEKEVVKDKYDYEITYTYSETGPKIDLRGKAVHNTNFHQYSQPTLFLGLSDKNFNLYTLQRYNHSPDSITKEFDNEWDFMMHPNHDYEVSTRGLTMTWGPYEHLFAKDSYMMLLTGADAMPSGLLVKHVSRNGGLEIGTDAGFGVYKWAYPMQDLDKSGKAQTITALGQAKTKTGSYQLLSYMSNDGVDHNYEAGVVDLTNNSLHLGLTKLNITHNDDDHPGGDDGMSLEENMSPTCEGLNFGSGNCSILGQVIFDPLGYPGGIGLGTGQGKNTKVGIVVDQNGNVNIKGRLVDPIMISAADYNEKTDSTTKETTKTVGGQGSVVLWNKINSGAARTEIVNVEPPGVYSGGFDFYNVHNENGNAVINGDSKPFVRLSNDNTFFNVKPTMEKGLNIPSISPVSFGTGSQDGNNQIVYMFYNPYNSDKQREISESESNRMGFNKVLDKDTFYFTNLRYGNNYKFDGKVSVTDMISTNKIKVSLSTPSSSSEACSAGEFKDDANYHYVCVSTNKWKRAALSDF